MNAGKGARGRLRSALGAFPDASAPVTPIATLAEGIGWVGTLACAVVATGQPPGARSPPLGQFHRQE